MKLKLFLKFKRKIVVVTVSLPSLIFFTENPDPNFFWGGEGKTVTVLY